MRKKQRPEATFAMPAICDTELRAIEHFILSEIGTDGYKIESDGYIYSSVADLPKDEYLREIIITLDKPTIVIDFRKYSAGVSVWGSDLQSYALVKKIEDIIQPTERTSRYMFTEFMFSSWWLGIVPTVAISLGFLVVGPKNTIWAIILCTSWIWMIFVLLCLWIAVRFKTISYCKVFTGRKGNLQKWWRTNKDQIIIQLFIGIALLLSGYWIGAN